MNLVKSEAKPIVVIQWRSWSCVTWNGTLSAAKELVQFGTVIKHTREWKLVERNFKIMNLNLFSSWKVRNSGKRKWQSSQHQICRQNIRHQKFLYKNSVWCGIIRSGKPNFMRLSLDKGVRHICYVMEAVLWFAYFHHDDEEDIVLNCILLDACIWAYCHAF